MTIPPHLSRFSSDPTHLTAVASVRHPDKKEFPSVAKLLDDLNFHDETHPDFLIRSSRFKSKSTLLGHRSSFIEHSAVCVHSSFKTQPSSLVTRVSRLDSAISPNQLSNHSPRPDPTIPSILLQSSSEPNSETPFSVPSPLGSELSSVSSSEILTESRKRSYASDDYEHNSESDESPTSALGLRINWQSKLNQPNTDYDRVIARPSRTWVKRTVDEPTERCLAQGNGPEDQLVELIVPRSFEIHQSDKRRRFIRSPRFHQVIR